VIARLDGDPNKLWDLERPLEASCKLELLTFDDEQGQQVFWHSSAHIMGEACERRWGCSLCIGPPIESGFYYEMALPDGGSVHESDWKPIETLVGSIVKEKQKFERLELSKEDLLEMFNYNKYKQHIIKDKIPDGSFTTVYRNGPLIDLCRGPHVPDTGRIEAFAIMKNSASYFLGSQENDSLQRLYGVSFPDKKRMAEHKKFLEEAAKRDHRKIGTDQELFFFHPLSPGSAFWMPNGGIIYENLMAYIREQYRKRRYKIVHTPNMFNADLWRQSGHWDYYQEDMFVIDVDKVKFGLKPMNCPGHCLMFGHRERTYKELPLRLADFGVLHRNEASGALSGLTRVRRFQQDDAHIFCREDQIKGEMDGLFDFLSEMYGMLGFTYKLNLSTRPDKYLGELATWDRAEDMLKASLNDLKEKSGIVWELNEGDGAFYGPKIDVKVLDSLRREWQVATFQLDFMNPHSFNLEYMVGDSPAKPKEKDEELQAPRLKSKDPQAVMDSAAGKPGSEHEQNEAKRASYLKPLTPGCARPVMIHRAMAGSIERFTGILCEHFGGRWPYWLSPRQIVSGPPSSSGTSLTPCPALILTNPLVDDCACRQGLLRLCPGARDHLLGCRNACRG
jgi:threonyl-tRNA synthetase